MGEAVAVLRCPNCGAPLEPGATRCEYCGYYIVYRGGVLQAVRPAALPRPLPRPESSEPSGADEEGEEEEGEEGEGGSDFWSAVIGFTLAVLFLYLGWTASSSMFSLINTSALPVGIAEPLQAMEMLLKVMIPIAFLGALMRLILTFD